MMSEENSPYRLPKNVVPSHYDISLKTDFVTFRFKGTETIQVQVKEATSVIKVNSLAVDIHKVEFITSSNDVVAAECCLDDKLETATFTFPKSLPKGDGQLKVEFTGTNGDNLKGFYRAQYLSPGGEEKYCLLTQFENTDARRAFPCWDEPAFKATFNITIQAPKDRTILSNMPVIAEDEIGDEVIVQFDKTPIMSTYLVALVVGDFSYVERMTKNNVSVKMYTPKNKQEYGQFAAECAAKLITYYEEYFAISYPLPKCDLIAVPNLANGAMENWGLVTARESCLLVNPSERAAKHKQLVTRMVGHELAHMWFGNLVTMEWWTDLWLNEGYASFVEFMCTDYLFPEFKIWNQFIGETLLSALRLDSLKNSHPIEVVVESANDVDEIFDDISYCKASSVIRMLHNYLGEKDFQKGMRLYLDRYKYKNCRTKDLWSALEEATGKPVAKLMSSWTLQTGFPLVSVTRGPNSTLMLKQTRFMADASQAGGGVKWVIPVSIMTSTCVCKQAVMYSDSMEVRIDDDDYDWIKVNPSWYGVYRTRYSTDLLEAFIPAIRNKTLPHLDRLSLIDDVFALVFSGQYDTVKALQLLEAYKDEHEYTVWTSICSALGKLTFLLEYTEYFERYLQFTRSIMGGILKKVGYYESKDEDHLITLLRSVIINRMSIAKDEGVIAQTRAMFDDHISGKALLSDDMKRIVYNSVMRHGDEKTANQLRKLHNSAELDEEKDRLACAMSITDNPALLINNFEFAMSDKVKSQDTIFVIASATGTKVGREMAWQFFKDKREDFNTKYGPNGDYLVSRMLNYIIERYVCLEKAKEMEDYFAAHPYPTSDRLLKQAFENVSVNSRWIQSQEKLVGNYLNHMQL